MGSAAAAEGSVWSETPPEQNSANFSSRMYNLDDIDKMLQLRQDRNIRKLIALYEKEEKNIMRDQRLEKKALKKKIRR